MLVCKDSDFFANNQKLREIRLDNNKLKSISVDFTKLKRLRFMFLNGNECIDMAFGGYHDSATIVHVQEAINANCTSPAN